MTAQAKLLPGFTGDVSLRLGASVGPAPTWGLEAGGRRSPPENWSRPTAPVGPGTRTRGATASRCSAKTAAGTSAGTGTSAGSASGSRSSRDRTLSSGRHAARRDDM